jgi:hypothetical protein
LITAFTTPVVGSASFALLSRTVTVSFGPAVNFTHGCSKKMVVPVVSATRTET